MSIDVCYPYDRILSGTAYETPRFRQPLYQRRLPAFKASREVKAASCFLSFCPPAGRFAAPGARPPAQSAMVPATGGVYNIVQLHDCLALAAACFPSHFCCNPSKARKVARALFNRFGAPNILLTTF